MRVHLHQTIKPHTHVADIKASYTSIPTDLETICKLKTTSKYRIYFNAEINS
jgi:hypothetical protein